MLILDRYQPTYEAGSGGFATVIVAWDTRIQREVAIKCLPLEEAARRDPAARINEGLRNFENPYANEESVSIMLNSDYASQSAIPGLEEARTAALLNDQNIAQIYDFEIQGGAAFIIMELVDGISLYDLLEYFPDRVDADVVAAVFKAVSHALEVAHKNHVLHLDVKPDNVLINRQGQVKVVDFGLARLEGGFGFGVATGGTIGYMPPEQMEREELDERCDQWALASLTYEMLMRGENPFRAETLEDALATIYDAEIVIPSLCMEDVDEAIDEAIFKALDPDKEGRYASVRSFGRDVKKALGNPKAGTKKLASLVAEALGEEAEEDGASGLFDEDDGRHAQGGASSRHAAEEDEFAGQGYAEDSAGAAYGKADDAFYDGEYSGKYSGEYDDYADYDSEAEPREYDEARANRIYSLVMRTLAFLGSALVGTLALSNLSMMPGWDSPVLWGSIAAVAVAGFAVPHVGALLAFTLVGLALVNNNALLVGSLVVVATFAWWYTIGRRGKGQANAALLSTCASSVGAGSLTPLLSAYFLAPLQALATTAFSAGIAVVLAGLGSVSITSWDVFQFGNIHMWTEVGPNILTTVQNPVTWAIIGSWLVSAPLASLMFQRGSRALTIFAVVLATAIICALPAATSTLVLGHNPDPVYLVLSIGCGGIALLVTLFAPPRH